MKKLFVVLAAMLTFTSTAFAQLGSLASDLVYTPVTPCRIFDTRISQGGTGPIAAEGTKNFVIWGVSSYASQGGAASNCGITAGSSTAAVAVNFTVVTPATPGFITAFPFGTTRPTAATVNFNAGDVRGNFSIAKNTQGSSLDLSIFSTSNVDVVGDVVGYYSKPVTTALSCTTLTAPINITASPSVFSVLTPSCPANSAVTGGGMNTAFVSAAIMFYQSSAEGSGWRCRGRNVDWASTWTGTCSVTCCSIPGR